MANGARPPRTSSFELRRIRNLAEWRSCNVRAQLVFRRQDLRPLHYVAKLVAIDQGFLFKDWLHNYGSSSGHPVFRTAHYVVA